MRVLVFGASGFIGKHLVQSLLQKKIDVVGVSTSDFPLTASGYTHIIADITNKASFGAIQGEFDCVFNTAAYITKKDSSEEAEKCLAVNALGVYNILSFMQEKGIQKFVHSSSCSVYGKINTVPITENVSLQPDSLYGVTKLTGEQFCHTFQKNIPTITILRYSSVFGKDCHADTVLPLFIKKATAGEDITLYDKGQRTQDFVYIHDVIEANVLAMGKNENGIFNITSGIETTMHDLAKDVIKVFGSSSKVLFDTTKKDDSRTVYSIEKATNMLGYAPKFILVKQMLEDYTK